MLRIDSTQRGDVDARLERHGYSFSERRLKLLSTPERRYVAERIAAALPAVAVTHAELSHGYYDGCGS